MKKGLKFILAGAAGMLPFAAFAQEAKGVIDILNIISNIINAIIPFVVGLAVLVIIWGIFGYITGAGDEEKRGEAKQYIIWGIIGVFVMLSIWGLVAILQNTFNIQRQGPTDFPTVPLSSGGAGAFVGGDCDGTAGSKVWKRQGDGSLKCE